MRYHGAQPRQGDLPNELHNNAMQVAGTMLAALMVKSGLPNDLKWALVGAVQAHLELVLPTPRGLVTRALELCFELQQSNYADEWKRADAIRTALAQTILAFEALLESSPQDIVYLFDLNRDTLLPEIIVKELQRLWVSPQEKSEP